MCVFFRTIDGMPSKQVFLRSDLAIARKCLLDSRLVDPLELKENTEGA